LVTTDNFNLKYKFLLFDSVGGNTVINDSVKITLEESEGGGVVKGCSRSNSDDTDGWRLITITPHELASLTKKQTMVLEGKVTVNDKTYSLQRKVRFRENVLSFTVTLPSSTIDSE
jgi:hypothetical protein